MPSLRVKDIPNSYEDARKLLGTLNIRNISHHGYLISEGNWPLIAPPPSIYLKLYDTIILRWYKDGRIDLDCGGHPTTTTQHWLNIALANACYISRHEKAYCLMAHYRGNANLLPITLYPSDLLEVDNS